MAENRKRGFKRLAIATGGLWFGGWGLIALSSYNTQLYFEAHYNKNATWDDTSNRVLMEMSNRASDDMAHAVQFGLFLPIALCPLILIGWWVYRGFKPKQ